MSGFTYNDELCHHGIKGQKWGVRRYQNEDGSLTREGRERYMTTEGAEKAQSIIRNGYYRRTKGQQGLSDKDYERSKKDEFAIKLSENYRKKMKESSDFQKSEGYKTAQAKASGLFATKRARLDYDAYRAVGRQIYEHNIREFMGESLESIYKLPKSQRDYYKALVMHIMDPSDF